jgi:hypothetical protein
MVMDGFSAQFSSDPDPSVILVLPFGNMFDEFAEAGLSRSRRWRASRAEEVDDSEDYR